MKQTSFFRFRFIGGALTLAGLFVFIWMIRLLNNEDARQLVLEGKDIQTRTEIVMPVRGSIYDKWGHLLAGNVEVYDIYADVRYVSDPDTVAATLSSVLGIKQTEIRGKLLNPGVNDTGHDIVDVKLAEFVTSEQREQILAIEEDLSKEAETLRLRKGEVAPNLDGIRFEPLMLRTYPEGMLGSNIIGFYNFKKREDASGVYGVEEKYNRLLMGTPVRKEFTSDPHLMDETQSEQIPPGANLILTIDRDIQSMAERVADEAMKSTGSESATILIMDPETGDILAMAVNPRLNPNEYWELAEVFPDPTTPYNRAVEITYEPGSIFKVLTMAAALDSGTVRPETDFLDTGVYYIGGVGIHNWDWGAWGPQTMTTCMQHSLNVCLAWVADQMGPTVFYNYLEKFGVGHTTGVDLAGEVSSPLLVQGDTDWYPINLGTNSYGQGVAVSPLQITAAIAAVANDGKLMMPRVLKTVIDNGEEYSNPPQVIGTPISAETARTLTDMLHTSLKEESSAALVEGYSVAGKTGTASIPGPGGYLSNATNASFIGWGPVDDPKFIVYVWLEEPAGEWGSVVAAPVFSQVVSELVVLMDLPPDQIREQIAGN